MRFLNCVVYLAVLGILCFPVGRLMARISFNAEAFPFAQTEFERMYKLYTRLKVKKWHNAMPDVSRIPGSIVPPKKIPGTAVDKAKIEQMIQETCIAELVHLMLCTAAFALPKIWPGVGGWIFFLIYVLIGNLPFIIIQRYNRPRLIAVRKYIEKRIGTADRKILRV